MSDKLGIIDFRNIIRAIDEVHEIDFSNHALTSFKHRLEKIMHKNNFSHADELISNIRLDKDFFEDFIFDISVTETEMFRDPSLWRVLRDEIFSEFSAHNKNTIWLPEATSGEDLYSLLILLHEIGVIDYVKIIVTSLGKRNIEFIKKGEYDIKKMEINDANYKRFKGYKNLKDYYTVVGNKAQMDKNLIKNTTFLCDDLLKNTVESRVNVIMFRNKMIYYNLPLQTKVLDIMHNVLVSGGILCIGIMETLEGYKTERNYNLINTNENILKKTFAE